MMLFPVIMLPTIWYSVDMKLNLLFFGKFFLLFSCLFAMYSELACAQIPASSTVSYPESYYSFRDSMLNAWGKTAEQFESEYKSVVQEIAATKSGWEKDAMLARCDYVLGRAYRYLGDSKKAGACFDKAIETCTAILKNHQEAEVYVIYADAISQNCSVRSKVYAMANGAKIKTFAKKALELDPAYGAAKYLENSQNIFTPAPFNNLEEGMKVLDSLLDTNQFRMDKYDIYSALSARAYGYLQQGMKDEALHWYNKALEMYPKNVAVLEILPTIQ